MHAQELAEQVPTVRRDTTGAQGARTVAEFRLNGLVVADDEGIPIAVIPGSQLLSALLPQYIRDDPHLAHALDEQAADDLCRQLNTVTLGDLIEAKRLNPAKLPAVPGDATVVEIVSAMDTGHYPLLVVQDKDGTYHGVVTMSRLLAAIATAAGEDSELIRRRLARDIIERGTPPLRPGDPELQDVAGSE